MDLSGAPAPAALEAAGSAPPARTAEALLDHVRSLHADLVADGADVSPLVLLATIEQRLRGRVSEEEAAARDRAQSAVGGRLLR